MLQGFHGLPEGRVITSVYRALLNQQSFSGEQDLVGMTITAALEAGVSYKFTFHSTNYLTSSAHITYLKIKDENNNVLAQTGQYCVATWMATISMIYVEVGTGATVTRKVTAQSPGAFSMFYGINSANGYMTTWIIERLL